MEIQIGNNGEGDFSFWKIMIQSNGQSTKSKVKIPKYTIACRKCPQIILVNQK